VLHGATQLRCVLDQGGGVPGGVFGSEVYVWWLGYRI